MKELVINKTMMTNNPRT